MSESRLQMTNWVHNAMKAVNGAFPQVNWTRESPEIQKAQDALDFYLSAYFYGEFDPPSVTLDQVREAWKTFYKLHIPGQQELI